MNLIYLHGFCSSPNSDKGRYFGERLASHGVGVHMPDLNGSEFRKMTLSGQLQQIGELCSELAGPIAAMGSSLGGFLAALYAQTDSRVERIVLMAPAFEFHRRFLCRLPASELNSWRATGELMVEHYAYGRQVPLDYRFVEDAAQYDEMPLERRLPALVMHGVHDEVVPWELGRDYLNRNSDAELLLLQSDHSLADKKAAMWRQVRGFLEL